MSIYIPSLLSIPNKAAAERFPKANYTICLLLYEEKNGNGIKTYKRW